MDVGEPALATIEVKEKWNDTGIEFVSGHEYRFAATGWWTDWWIECDADGYASPTPILKTTEGLRRSPCSRWFALIGAINEDKRTQFEVGTERTLIAPASETLTCFANDLSLMYWNNRDSVQLIVTRMR